MKEFRKEVQEARAQSSAVVRSKETAEHRLDMAKEEVQFQGNRIQKRSGQHVNEWRIGEHVHGFATT